MAQTIYSTTATAIGELVPDFREHGYFGLGESNVYFFQQGSMPAVDLATGRLLLEAPGRVFTSPNGHGEIGRAHV